jgi:voltage-gated sodium channel
VIALARRLSESPRFHHAILGVILLAAVVVGLETSETLTARYGTLFGWIDAVVQAVFVVEIAIRLIACWPRLGRFFTDGWNVFDLAVVSVSLLPQSGSFAMVARLARLMRVTRIVSAFPELRLIVSTMLRSIPSMGHVLMMLGLLLYVYGVLGVSLFRAEDAEHWRDLPTAFLTLFQMLTLEGWVEIQAAVLDTYPWAWLYFASFVFVAVFVVVNLFIAVVINNLETAKTEHQAELDRSSPHRVLLQSLEDVRDRVDAMERVLRTRAAAPADGDGAATGRRQRQAGRH